MTTFDNNTLKRIQNIQIDILKEVMRICKKYNLRYFLLGGSCLGAIRHKGIIPWDDDVDVGMPRPDYEKFIEIAQSELPEYYFLQNAQTEPDFPICFSKIRDSRTTFKEKSVSHLNINHGVYFDIFPLDGLPTSKLFELKYKFYYLNIQKAYNIRDYRKGISRVVYKIISSFIPDYRKARDKMIKLVKKYNYNSCRTVANHFGAWEKKERHPRECFGNGSEGVFEGLTVSLPADPDFYCRQLYGDYMQLPPEDRRVSHHTCTVLDLNRSYKEYINA